ncbi:MAG: cyclomaltodextrin glucanotransferase, partial [Pseudomonadota bacterium]
NRNYFGQARVDAARDHPIRHSLKRIAEVRKRLPALQHGLQLNLRFSEDTAAFFRVYQHAGVSQTVLVLLNKGDETAVFADTWLGSDTWQDELTGVPQEAGAALSVAPHSVRVFSLPSIARGVDRERLQALQNSAQRSTN